MNTHWVREDYQKSVGTLASSVDVVVILSLVTDHWCIHKHLITTIMSEITYVLKF